jgi:Transposase domain (DUF772)/Transposase DDE domain
MHICVKHVVARCVFKRSLVMFFEGIRSERQWLALAADRLSVRRQLGYGLDEVRPDASGFTRLRQRLGLAVFRRFFEHVVDLCQDAGLVWGKEVVADATRVPGDASMDSLVPRLRAVVDDHLVALFGGDAVVDDGDDSPRGDSGRWDLLETCRLDQSRPPSGSHRRLSARKISRTDPDAAAMAMRDGRTVLGCQDHDLVDGGKARIILHGLVTPGDVAENQVLLDQLRRTLVRRKIRPQRLIADAKYATGKNIRALEEQGIRAYVPLPEWDKSSSYDHNAAFTYDGERDLYRCPQGQVLKLEWTDETGERTYRPGARRELHRLSGEKRMHEEQPRTPGQPLLSRRASRPRPRPPTDGGLRESAQETKRVGRAVVRRGEAVARPGTI